MTSEPEPEPPQLTEPNKRSELLLSAAHQLLGERDLEALTIRALLDRSGLSRRAFYECYASKDALVIAVFARTLRQGAAYYNSQAGEYASPTEALRHIVTSIITNAHVDDGSGNLNRALAFAQEHLKLAAFHPNQLEDAVAPFVDMLRDVIAKGIREGEFVAADPRLTAKLVYNLVSATVHEEILNSGTGRSLTPPPALADCVWAFCERALASP
ncbi:TetR/AcrR family transcriptional regulator [Sphingobium tyrosinilyticum]|uniref:TetR/AcrR family transcriptional regulator n=1 Tax=Sphingobium tyrosinilyticum TaxID=2715436 RepID=A0ABV9F2E2_9SPHN